MRLPRALARFNRRVTNPVQMIWAPRAPGFGVIEHVGRRSGAVYRTPMNVFVAPGGFVVLLTYGSATDWLRNVQAAGHAELVHRRRSYRISDPHILTDGSGRALLPAPIRLVSRMARLDDVLRLTAEPG